ncbi:MAG: hypothetical protein R3344_03380 [Acidobacteriota bacterium]|nr:hypothetical protein [Acidobacteriota bacterium]
MRCLSGILLVVVLAAWTPAGAQEAEPRFEADTRLIDLGELVRGDVVEAEFTIGNSGGAVLEIVDAVPG